MDIADRGEDIGLMEPLLLSDGSREKAALAELAFELGKKSAGFQRSLPAGIHKNLADLVRVMNCYYSNLIEEHHTHPVDIQRALARDFSDDKKKRDLQREAVAHVEVQRWIDGGGLGGAATTTHNLLEMHKRFCDLLPEDLLWVENPDTNEKLPVVGGQFRTTDVAVGCHIPVSAGAVPRFMARFEQVYSSLSPQETVLAAAAAHHRFAWVHPFPDGNGRVARLMSHAMLMGSLDTGGLWSVSRGLARQVAEYKRLLAEADLNRRNDLDGRGNLSTEALVNFSRFFLERCLDQVNFMEGLMQPDKLRQRILQWAKEESVSRPWNSVMGMPIHEKSANLLEAILYRGELPRSEVGEVLGVSDRTGRRVVSDLTGRGVLASESVVAPLRLAFPATLAFSWMPGLFPEQ